MDRLSPISGKLPTAVSYPYVISDGSVTPGQHASFLGKGHDPLLVLQEPNSPVFSLPELSLPQEIPFARLQARRGLQQMIDAQARLLDFSAQARGLDGYYERAITMLQSPNLREAFNLSAEPGVVREAYGRTTYGQSCLLARRLVEAGTKFVTVYFSDGIGGQSTERGGWDTHGFNNTRMFPIGWNWESQSFAERMLNFGETVLMRRRHRSADASSQKRAPGEREAAGAGCRRENHHWSHREGAGGIARKRREKGGDSLSRLGADHG